MGAIITPSDQAGFIKTLSYKLYNSVIEYEAAMKKSGGNAYYTSYISDSTATKEAIRQRILEIRRELLKLSKEL